MLFVEQHNRVEPRVAWTLPRSLCIYVAQVRAAANSLHHIRPKLANQIDPRALPSFHGGS